MVGFDLNKLEVILGVIGGISGFIGGMAIIVSSIYKKIVKPTSNWVEQVNKKLDEHDDSSRTILSELKVNGGGSIKDAVNDIRAKTQVIYNSMQRVEVKNYLDSQPMFECDIDGRAIYFNRAMLQVMGINHEEAEGYGWASCILDSDHSRVLAEWHEAILGKEFSSIYTIVNKRTGEHFKVRSLAQVKRNTDIQFIVGILEILSIDGKSKLSAQKFR